MRALLGLLCVLSYCDFAFCDFFIGRHVSHIRTDREFSSYREYEKDPESLRRDLDGFLVLDSPGRFNSNGLMFTNFSVFREVDSALEKILQVDCGKRLLRILVSKLRLRREALCALGRGISELESIGSEQRRLALNLLLKACYLKSSDLPVLVYGDVPSVNDVLERLTTGDGWEYWAEYALVEWPKVFQAQGRAALADLQQGSVQQSVAPLCQREISQMLGMIQEAIDKVSIGIVVMGDVSQLSHAFFPLNGYPLIKLDFSLFGMPEECSCFESTSHRLVRRNVCLDEILFHELCHALHYVEGQGSLPPFIEPTLGMSANQFFVEWRDVEEFRTVAGCILSTVKGEGEIGLDKLCTFVYDIEQHRMPRWPYAVLDDGCASVQLAWFLLRTFAES